LTTLDRRTALQWVMAASALHALPRHAAAGANKIVRYDSESKGYGTDPNLLQPVMPWERTMTPHQLQLTAVLSDLILPGTAGAPAPSVIGIPDFVDEWISAPYPDQRRDRSVILAGLAGLDREATRRWQRGFLELDQQPRRQILETASTSRGNSASPNANGFFRRFRFLVVSAYYTTPEGFRDIGYTGNVAMSTYPAPTKEEIALLDKELGKLGLSMNRNDPGGIS
jgi:hypothetical protein